MTEPVRDPEHSYWLCLARAPGVGPVKFAQFLEHFGTPRAVFGAGEAAWEAAGIRGRIRDYLRKPDWAGVEADLAWIAQPDHDLLTLADPRYPSRLKEIHDAPPVLFVQGDPAALSGPLLAMVGSRNPSRGGEDTAREFARHLGGMGVVIVSGLAIGIDAASHQGALAGGGHTVAVAGTGLDTVYPARHEDLALQIREQGALVSEVPPGGPARSQHFPRRNRIISGLSLGTLVVEATLRSGSLITARQAGEQGREVFAIPGSIHNPLAKGCHALIKQGAKLVETAEDILEELQAVVTLHPVSPPTLATTESTPSLDSTPGLDQDYACLLARMTMGEPITVDRLVEQSNLGVDTVSSMLLILELRGLVAAQDGGRYTRLGQREES